jgi:phosphoribosylaminoimidazole-succinocarboxamide synthase
MGSVKDLAKGDTLAGKLWTPTTPHTFGRGAWKVSGRFSVGDLKGIIPHEFEIKDKNHMLAMTAGAYYEEAGEQGIQSCYLGMMDHDGKIVSVKDLLGRGELSDVIVMQLANTPPSGKAEDVAAYHEAIKRGDITVYVADVESIFRAGLPLGSSVFKKICNTMGLGDKYELAATYDETELLLAEVRGATADRGMPEALAKYLNTLGLDGIPSPGHKLPRPVFNYTTKFAESGDADITEADAIGRLGGDEQCYQEWRSILQRCTDHQIAYSKERDTENMDGKVENVVANRKPILTDFACTVDENRLMIRYARGGIIYLIPSNKEIQRAVFRARGIYNAIEQAKKIDKEKWKEHLFKFTTKQAVEEATRESIYLMENAIGVVGNRTLGRNVFDAKPIDTWVEGFLPYASRVQDKKA